MNKEEFKEKLIASLCYERDSLYQLLNSFDRIAENEDSVIVVIPKGVFTKFRRPFSTKTKVLSPAIQKYVSELMEYIQRIEFDYGND